MAQDTNKETNSLELSETSQINVELEPQHHLRTIVVHCEMLIRTGCASLEDYERYVKTQLELARQET